MLIAVVMLFFMSYWLLSKVESRRWKARLEGKLDAFALSRLAGGAMADQLSCQIYREGAETVLFLLRPVGDAQSVSGHLLPWRQVCYWLRAAAGRVAHHALLGGASAAPNPSSSSFPAVFMYLMAFVLPVRCPLN